MRDAINYRLYSSVPNIFNFQLNYPATARLYRVGFDSAQPPFYLKPRERTRAVAEYILGVMEY